MVEISEWDKNVSQHLSGNVRFAYKFGVVTATEPGILDKILIEIAKTGKLIKGVGLNSATAQLGHELIHAYNYKYDKGEKIGKKGKPLKGWKKGVGYYGRRADKSTKTDDENKRSYDNGEEKYTTLLSNQINSKLKEAIRWDYRGALYFKKNHHIP